MLPYPFSNPACEGYATDLAVVAVRADIHRIRAIKFIQLHAVDGVQPPTQLVDENFTTVVPHLLKELGWQLLPSSGAVLPHAIHPFVRI